MNQNSTTTDRRTTTTEPNRSTRRVGRIVAACSLALVLGGLAVGCSDDNTDAVSTDTLDAALTATTSTTAADATVAGAGGSSSGGSSSGGSSSGGSSSGGSSTAKPVIVSFSTPESIDCHNGNQQNFTASWSTTNATKVTISIDGPGVYDTYGPSGETSLPFSCSSSHSFLLTAYGSDGTTVTKQVTLQPRNVQTQGSSEPDQP